MALILYCDWCWSGVEWSDVASYKGQRTSYRTINHCIMIITINIIDENMISTTGSFSIKTMVICVCVWIDILDKYLYIDRDQSPCLRWEEGLKEECQLSRIIDFSGQFKGEVYAFVLLLQIHEKTHDKSFSTRIDRWSEIIFQFIHL